MDAEQPTCGDPRWYRSALWAFIGLGIFLRVGRYLMNWPLWWDEAFVGVNLLRRGYIDLLRPLDYGQVCPLLFLWAELTIVKLLGFSEATLRLLPIASGVVSLLLFSHIASRVLTGTARLLAVAIFAVAFYPIRHAADAKPYASDLLVALVLIALALAWSRARHPRWLWVLALFGPVAIGLSYPAAFMVGGIGLALVPTVWRSERFTARAAFLTFLASSITAFVVLFLVVVRGQAHATMPGMGADWAGSFPPVADLPALARWLVVTHTGSMLAYPCGGEGGWSVLTLLLCVTGATALWRRNERFLLALCLAPLGVAFVAAALHRYPYGGSARFMLYVAPAACLLAGVGAASFLALLPSARRHRLLCAVLGGLVLVGCIPFSQDMVHPYRAVHAWRAREFARQFWAAQEHKGNVACLRWDYGIGRWDSIYLNVAVYLCNQKIYCHSRHVGAEHADPQNNRLLRCVLAEAPDVTVHEVDVWITAMVPRYLVRGRETLTVNMAEPGAPPRLERYTIFELVPRAESGLVSR